MRLHRRLERLEALRPPVPDEPWDRYYPDQVLLRDQLVVDWRSEIAGTPAVELDRSRPEARLYARWSEERNRRSPDARSVVVELALQELTEDELRFFAEGP